MRLMHTSDWHLGMTLKGGTSFIVDQRFMIDEICRVAIEEKVDGIIIAGDIFDKGVASSEAIRLYDEAMTHIVSDLGIKVYIIAGNHDGAARLAQCNELLAKCGLYVCGSLESEPFCVNEEETDIYFLPWISTYKVKSVYPEAQEQVVSLEDAYKVTLDKYRETFVSGHRHILISHAFIVNAQTSVSDRSAEAGGAAMVGAKVFEGFDYVALGHLHGPQKINDCIRYSGTPMTYSFGKEEVQQKGVVIIDTDTLEQKEIPVRQLHRRVTLTATYDELLRADYDEDILKGYVRLEITDTFAGMEAMAALRERYDNILEFSSKNYEKEDSRITMTMEELENAERNPEFIFDRYCEDIMQEPPSEHMKELFLNALKKITEEE